MSTNKKWMILITLAAMVAMILPACAPQTPQVIEKPVVETVVVEKPVVETVVVEKPVVETVVVEKEVVKEVVVTSTPMPPTATPVSGPRKGGGSANSSSTAHSAGSSLRQHPS